MTWEIPRRGAAQWDRMALASRRRLGSLIRMEMGSSSRSRGLAPGRDCVFFNVLRSVGMPLIELETEIRAPVERVFDLARSIDAHVVSAVGSGERAVAGRTSGMIGLGETVTWEAKHFGVRQRLTVRITGFDRPRMFEDEMIEGAFASMRHVHRFEVAGDGTKMRDEFSFSAPLGAAGRIAERLFLTRYMRRFLSARNNVLKNMAESDDWRRCIPEGAEQAQALDGPSPVSSPGGSGHDAGPGVDQGRIR